MEEQFAAIRFLATEIGPRPPTSAAEAKAAAYVNSRLRQANMDVDLQAFRATASAVLPQGLIYTALILAPIVYLYSPPVALAFGLLGLAAFVAEALAVPVLSSWLPGGESQNVVGTRPSAHDSRQHLVILAHLDSPRVNWLCHPRLVGNYRRIFWVTVGAMVALVLTIGLGWWFNTEWWWYTQLLPAGLLVLSFLFLVQRELLMPSVAGANDNASGLAVLMRLAEELQGLQYTDLWLVATGCQEGGLQGARRFFAKYPFPRDSTYIINLDTIGQGELGIVVREGILHFRAAAPYLVNLAAQAEADDITIDADPRTYALANTDAQVALARGYNALSLMAFETRRSIPVAWHWSGDTADHIQPELLERATRLAVGIARRLDRAAAEKIP